MRLLEVLVADLELNVDDRGAGRRSVSVHRKRRKRLADELAHGGDVDVAGRRDHQIVCRVRVGEIGPEGAGIECPHRLGRPEDGPSQRMLWPEFGGKDLVDEVVGRVLDHFDLFEHDVLLATDIVVANAGFRSRSLSTSTARGRCSSSTLM